MFINPLKDRPMIINKNILSKTTGIITKVIPKECRLGRV
jgi:hypothetical protein